jgi:hypothetical protein
MTQQPSIFISYSHKDEVWKDRLVGQLKVLELEGAISVWEDRQIETGSDWYGEIEQALNRASLAILLISSDFLTSNFIRSEEVPRLLERRGKEGMRLFPIIVRPCPWARVGWLSKIQVRPKNGKPLASMSDYEAEDTLANIAMEIEEMLKRGQVAPAPTPASSSRPTPAKMATPEPGYNTTAIRQLLTAAFSDEELTAFCFDNFPEVYDKFGGGMSRTGKVQELIEHCQKRLLFDKLLQLVEQANPAQYERFRAQLRR